MKTSLMILVSVIVFLLIPLSLGLTWLVYKQDETTTKPNSGFIFTTQSPTTAINAKSLINDPGGNDGQSAIYPVNSTDENEGNFAKPSDNSPTMVPDDQEETSPEKIATSVATDNTQKFPEPSRVYWSKLGENLLELEQEYGKVMEMILSPHHKLPFRQEAKPVESDQPTFETSPKGNTLKLLANKNPPKPLKTGGWASIADTIYELEVQRENSFNQFNNLKNSRNE